MIKVKADWILSITGYAGTTIAPFTFYHSRILKLDKERLDVHWNHERIHIRQQAELLYIGFYVLYAWYYIKGRFAGLDNDEAYEDIPFELEAHDHDGNLNYLSSRKRGAWKIYR